MCDVDVQPVLRCTLCNKPFDKPASLKRHGYYCRSRKPQPIVKIRSCTLCIKAKVQCDRLRPSCSRCKTKKIGCEYSAKVHKSVKPAAHDDSSMILGPGGKITVDAAEYDEAVNFSEQELAHIADELIRWDDTDLNPDSLQAAEKMSPGLGFRRDVATLQSYFSGSTNELRVSLPAQPAITVRSLTWRPGARPGEQKIARMMLDTLRSYPLMMLQHGKFPPFIHPLIMSESIASEDVEYLHNCINLVHMIKGRHPGGRKLFWKNVRQECEELQAKASQLTLRGVLAAMQALSVYILIRMDEGETEHNNLDWLLRYTLLIVILQFGRHQKAYDTSSGTFKWATGSDWTDWILEESKRRMCLIFRVIELLVYFEPTALCTLQSDLMLAPLPSRKSLWEAGDDLSWTFEQACQPEQEGKFALATNGDLVQLDPESKVCSGRISYKPQPANWQMWAAGMDGLGGLVMLTASLT